MSRCRPAVAAVALLLCALLLPIAHSADEPKPVVIKGEGFRGLTFSPDGKTLAVATRFDGIELREPATGKKTAARKGYARGDVAFSSDGTMLAAPIDGTWPRDPKKLTSFREQTFASLWFKEAVRIWDVQTGQVKLRLSDVIEMRLLVFSPDGKRVAAAARQTVHIFDIAAERLVANWYHDEHRLTVIAFSPDGTRLAVGTEKGPIHLVNAASGGTVKTLDEHTRPVLALAFEPDGKYLHSAASNSVRRWNLAAGTAELLAIKHYTEITRMAFSPDRRFVACGDDRGGGAVWDTATGEQRHDFYGSADPITCLAFSPDGKLLASGTETFRDATGDFTSTLTIHPIDLPAKK